MRLFYAIFGVVYLTSSVAFAFGPVQSYQSQSAERSEVVSSVGDEGPLPLMRALATGDDRDYEKWLHKVSDFEEWPVENPVGPTVRFEPWDHPDQIKKWCKDFDNIFVVNTANAWVDPVTKKPAPHSGQHMDLLHVDGCDSERPIISVVKSYPVSTGLETWVCKRNKDPKGNDLGNWVSEYVGTKSGFYPTGRCDADHRSNLYSDANMTHACNLHDGTFVHEGNPAEWGKLGKSRASHGCIRLGREDAAEVFAINELSGGPINPDAKMFWGQCPPSQKLSPEECQKQPGVLERTRKYKQEALTLIQKGSAMTGREGSALPYSTAPEVPIYDPSGARTSDENSNTTRPGKRSMFVVQCIDKNGRDCAIDQPLTPQQAADPTLPRNRNQVPPSPPLDDKWQARCQAQEDAAAAREGRAPLPAPPTLSGLSLTQQAPQATTGPSNPLKGVQDFFNSFQQPRAGSVFQRN